jgi:hypothetical protein
LHVHKVELSINYTNGGHGCIQDYDFNELFRTIEKKKQTCLTCVIENTKRFIKIFDRAIEEHLKKCPCDCVCQLEECMDYPEGCECVDCMGIPVPILGKNL